MKKSILSLILFASCAASQAQFKIVAEGAPFDEPESGFGKILQLKNGNTLFLHVTYKDGIDVKIYDANHGLKSDKHFNPAYGNLKNGSIDGLFELNNDAVLLISELDAKMPVLYRLIVDGNSGALKDYGKIAELPRVDKSLEYSSFFGIVTEPLFFVKKDPAGDFYAVVIPDLSDKEKSKKIDIICYGADNKEINRATYVTPENKFKYLRYLDMAMMDKGTVSMLAFAYSVVKDKNEGEFVLATMNHGSTSLVTDELSFGKKMVFNGGLLKYDPVTQKLIFFSTGRADAKDSPYEPYLSIIDPAVRKLDNITKVYPDIANKKSLETFGKDWTYTGLPQNLYINPDGSFSLVYEEVSNFTVNFKNSYRNDCQLGSVAVSVFDKNGNRVNEYLIPKSQNLYDARHYAYYQSEREGKGQLLSAGNQYKSFSYFNTGERSFVVLNDIERNEKAIANGTLTQISGLGECDGFYFELKDKDVLPKRQFALGKPEGKKEHNMVMFSVADYNREKNVYATLKFGKDGRKKAVNMVWLQPQ